MKKRFLSIALTLCMVLTLLPAVTPKVSAVSGDGTADSPYLVTNAAELAAVTGSGYYKLKNSITLSGTWKPLPSFSGTLDGAGYTVSGLSVSGVVTDSADDKGKIIRLGLFETIGSGGTVKNLTVAGTITGSGSSTYSNLIYPGGIAGENRGTIENCTNLVNITQDGMSDATIQAGGICAMSFGTITGCRNAGSISASNITVSSFACIAGIVGKGNGIVRNCCNTGTISTNTGTDKAYYAGGIVGWFSNQDGWGGGTYLENCYNTGSVSGGMAGGIASYAEAIYLKNCYNYFGSSLPLYSAWGAWQGRKAVNCYNYNGSSFVDVVNPSNIKTPEELLTSLNNWVKATAADGTYLTWKAGSPNPTFDEKWISYDITINIKKDDEVWTGCSDTVTIQDSGNNVKATLEAEKSTVKATGLSKGSYGVYVGAAKVLDVTIDGSVASTEKTLNYYTISVANGNHMSGAKINNSTSSYIGLLNSTVAVNGGTAATGYQFDKWTLSSGTAPTWESGKAAADVSQTITVSGAATLTATAKLSVPTVAVTGKNGAGAATSSAIYEDAITLTATPSHALGDGVTYTNQWYKGGTADSNLVSGSTNPTLLLRNVDDSGDYYCKVTAANSDSTALVSSVTSTKTTVTISKKPVAFTVSGTSQTYQPGTARSITITDTRTKNLTASDFTVKYYKVDEDNGVLSSTTPVVNAVSTGRYLYVIDFASAQPNYTIISARHFTVNDTTLPTIANYDNVGYLDIKAGTEQQQPISFASGAVSKYVADGAFTNVLTNPNSTTATYQSSDTNVATVATDGTVTIKAAGSTTITATSQKDGTSPVYASYTLTVTKEAVTVTVRDKMIQYSDAMPYTDVYALSFSKSIGEADYDATSLSFSGYTQGRGTGEYTIIAKGLTSDKYIFTYEAGTLTVNPKLLTESDFTVSVADKEYDSTTNANFTITVDSVNGDVLTAVYTGAFDNANAADSVTATCTITGVAGSKADNYTLSSAVVKTAAAKISPMPIAFTFGTTTYLYDGQEKTVTVSAVDSKNRVFSDFTVKYDGSTSLPSAVGNYTVTAVLTDEANYTTSFNTATLTITEGNVVVWASSGTSQKYDGSVKNINAMSVPTVPTVVSYYAITDDGNVGDSVDMPTDVGRYLYVITQTDTNYKIKNSVSFLAGDVVASLTGSNFGIMEILENVQPTLSFSDPLVSVTYGDAAFTETPNGGATSATITYQSSDTDIVTVNGSGEVTVVKPGLATITATAKKDGFGDVTATYAVQVAKKAVTLSVDAETSVTYNGEIRIIPYQLTSDLDGNKLSVSDITFTYTDQSDPNKHTPKNAGTYLSIAQVKADNEFYTSGQATGLLKITPAPLTVTADNKTITYGDIAPAYSVSYTPLGDDTLGCLEGTAEFECTYKQFDNKGGYIIKPSGLTSFNYTITFVDGTLTVNSKTITLNWSAGSLPYIGAAQCVTANVGGLVNGDTASVTTYTGNEQINISSSYEAEATSLSNENYTLTGSANIVHTWSITAVSPSLKLSNQKSNNTGSPITIGSAKVTGVGNDGDMTVQYSTTYTYYTDAACQTQTTTSDGAAAKGGAPSKNGTYYVKAEISAHGNYTGAMAIATLTINTPSSGDGGSGGASGGSTTVTVPLIGSGTTVKTDVTTSGSTVTVKEPTAANLEKVVAAAAADKQPVEIDLSALSGTLTNIVLPANTISAAGKSAQSKGISGLTVIAPNGNQVTFDRTATATIADAANGGTLSLSIDERALSQQTTDETALLSGRSAANIFDLTLKDAPGNVVSDFDGGTAMVILRNIKMTGSLGDYALFHKTGGKLISQSFTSTATGTANVYDLTIPTTGWSSYILTYDEGSNPFTDVASDSYYYDAVLWALDNGVTSGTTAAAFNPDGICTRAQAVTFLWRAMGSPEPTSTSCPFTDVTNNAYYYKAVLWATENGITVGISNTTFSPDTTVTRSQTVTLLWRTADKPTVTTANLFSDVESDAYYANAVLWAVSKGITSGTGNATFGPDDGCTRAQIVTFLYRYLSK